MKVPNELFHGLTSIPRRKIDMYILPLMCSTYMPYAPPISDSEPRTSHVLVCRDSCNPERVLTALTSMTFADKISLGQAAVLGILFVYRSMHH